MNDNQRKDDRFNKYISIALVVTIIFALSVYAYTRLVEKEPETPDGDKSPVEEPEEILLTISVDSEIFNYSLNDLMTFDIMAGQGSYINKIGKVTGPNNYTGISISRLLESIEDLPDRYTVQAVASDGYSLNYSLDEINGHIAIYDETGKEIDTGTMTMTIAYKENGELLNENMGGPLRIAFVDDSGSITDSSLWLRSLIKIEII